MQILFHVESHRWIAKKALLKMQAAANLRCRTATRHAAAVQEIPLQLMMAEIAGLLLGMAAKAPSFPLFVGVSW